MSVDPALDELYIHSFMDLDFHIPQLNQLIARVERFKQPNQAEFLFEETMIVRLPSFLNDTLAGVPRAFTISLSFVEKLDIDMTLFPVTFPALQNDMDPMQWLELFHPFIAVQSLRVTKDLVPLVAPALQDLIGDRAAEVLPPLRNLLVEGEGLEPSGSLWEAMQPFVTARQLSDHPVAIEFKKIE
ncbi:hypothetical protein BC827DRAFT_1373773 [Russula dissimulans]|nr:hypothetical protein BC827DRAFT_1373773 [Russula dissimulans]